MPHIIQDDRGNRWVYADGQFFVLRDAEPPTPPDPHVAALHAIAAAIDGLAAAVRGERAKVRDDGK